MIYLASPYTHENPEIVKQRVNIAGQVSAKLLELGIHSISPVVYGQALIEHGQMTDSSWDYWGKFCGDIMDICDQMYILDIDGWNDSKGIIGETDYMKILGKPVLLLNVKAFLLDGVVLVSKMN